MGLRACRACAPVQNEDVRADVYVRVLLSDTKLCEIFSKVNPCSIAVAELARTIRRAHARRLNAAGMAALRFAARSTDWDAHLCTWGRA